MSDEDFLPDWQIDAINYIERHFNISGAPPPDADILEYLKITKKYPNVSLGDIRELKKSSLFKKSLQSRGIELEADLTQRQLAAASVMLNLTDRRSDEKKLRDIGVSTEEFSTWMQSSTFAEYMRLRSEQMINNSVHEAHMGLMRGVRQGNTASIKLYYEMTGRYNPNEENNVNIRLLIGKVLEAIQKHVRDPNTLNSLAIELSQLAVEAGSPTSVAGTNIIQNSRKELDGA